MEHTSKRAQFINFHALLSLYMSLRIDYNDFVVKKNIKKRKEYMHPTIMFSNLDLELERRRHPENSGESNLDNLYDHLELARDNNNIYQINRLTRIIDEVERELTGMGLKGNK